MTEPHPHARPFRVSAAMAAFLHELFDDLSTEQILGIAVNAVYFEHGPDRMDSFTYGLPCVWSDDPEVRAIEALIRAKADFAFRAFAGQVIAQLYGEVDDP